MSLHKGRQSVAAWSAWFHGILCPLCMGLTDENRLLLTNPTNQQIHKFTMAVIEIKLLFVIALVTFLVKGDVPKPIVADIFAREWGEITQARNVPLKLGERSK